MSIAPGCLWLLLPAGPIYGCLARIGPCANCRHAGKNLVRLY